MQSLVLGATGLVGRHIVNQLIAAGERPFALSRSAHGNGRDVQWLTGDLGAPDTLELPDFQTLYCTVHCHLLATALPCLARSGMRRAVFFTSTSILTKLSSADVLERTNVKLLADSEQEAITACEKQGVAWTVLRPTIIYDEGQDPSITRLARLIGRFGFFPLAGSGKGLRQPVHAEDLAIGALQAMASDAAVNRIYSVPVRRSSRIAKWSDAFSMVSTSRAGSSRCRQSSGAPHSIWRAAIFQMRMPRWASECRRIWFSTLPWPRGISTGVHDHSTRDSAKQPVAAHSDRDAWIRRRRR